jgi:ABC-type transporter Mla MlaB component
MWGFETHQSEHSTTFRIEGKFAGRTVEELEKCWRSIENPAGPLRLDLCRVGEIDEAGKELLRQMFASGVEFVVAARATSSRIN